MQSHTHELLGLTLGEALECEVDVVEEERREGRVFVQNHYQVRHTLQLGTVTIRHRLQQEDSCGETMRVRNYSRVQLSEL